MTVGRMMLTNRTPVRLLAYAYASGEQLIALAIDRGDLTSSRLEVEPKSSTHALGLHDLAHDVGSPRVRVVLDPGAHDSTACVWMIISRTR